MIKRNELIKALDEIELKLNELDEYIAWLRDEYELFDEG